MPTQKFYDKKVTEKFSTKNFQKIPRKFEKFKRKKFLNRKIFAEIFSIIFLQGHFTFFVRLFL